MRGAAKEAKVAAGKVRVTAPLKAANAPAGKVRATAPLKAANDPAGKVRVTAVVKAANAPAPAASSRRAVSHRVAAVAPVAEAGAADEA